MYAKFSRTVKVYLAVINEQCFTSLNMCSVKHGLIQCGFRFFQMNHVRQEDMFKPCGCVLTMVFHHVVPDVFPVYLVAIAENIEVEMFPKLSQSLKALWLYGRDKAYPCIVNLLVCYVGKGALPLQCSVEFFCRGRATIYLLEDAFKLRILFGEDVVRQSDFLEFCKTSFFVKVTNHSSKIEDDVFYVFVVHAGAKVCILF